MTQHSLEPVAGAASASCDVPAGAPPPPVRLRIEKPLTFLAPPWAAAAAFSAPGSRLTVPDVRPPALARMRDRLPSVALSYVPAPAPPPSRAESAADSDDENFE